jgi:hypothetical protein
VKPHFTAINLLLAVCLFFNTLSSFSQCFPAPVVPVYTPARISIIQNQTVTYTISNAVFGYFYEVIDSAFGESLGPGVMAMSNGSLSVTTDPFIINGIYTIFIRATYLLGPTQCVAVSAYGTVIVNASVLPLELLQFKGRRQGTGILLEWQTANEDRINRFEIERSETGSLFEDIGHIAATAQPNAGKNYMFTDAHPSGSANYYRLKMVDQDGKFSYSHTILIKATGLFTANVLPNPFTDLVIIGVALEKPQPLYVRLINTAGSLVYTREVKGRQGNNTIQLNDLAALPAGSYFLQVRGTEHAIQQKIVKTNR